MKRRLRMAALVLILCIGLGLIAYPFVSYLINQMLQGSVIQNYKTAVSTLSEEEAAAELEAAQAYNDSLKSNVVLTDPFDSSALQKTTTQYHSLLNMTEDGIMGYVKIPKISVNLPIYHGTGEDVLRLGAGHLEGTSLPIGGEGNHTVLSAHTGLPTARMFDRLTDIEIGDVFYISVLRDTLAYEVDQIMVVTPDDIRELRDDPNEDYATLVTCTPYGVNSHRILVRGYRIPYDPDTGEGYIVWVFPGILICVVFILGFGVRKVRKAKKKKGRE